AGPEIARSLNRRGACRSLKRCSVARQGEHRMPAPTRPPLAITDNQLTFIMQICEPLAPNDRSAFLLALAEALQHQREIGDGVLHRKARELFARFFRPPVLSTPQPARHERSSRLKDAAPIA